MGSAKLHHFTRPRTARPHSVEIDLAFECL